MGELILPLGDGERHHDVRGAERDTWEDFVFADGSWVVSAVYPEGVQSWAIVGLVGDIVTDPLEGRYGITDRAVEQMLTRWETGSRGLDEPWRSVAKGVIRAAFLDDILYWGHDETEVSAGIGGGDQGSG